MLVTVDDKGYPHTSFTWVVAVAPDRLRFGADHGGTSAANLTRSGSASVQIIIDEGQPYLVKGNAGLTSAEIKSAPFRVVLAEMEITEVRDQSWIGVNVRPFAYEWAPEERENLQAVEQAIYAEMRAYGS